MNNQLRKYSNPDPASATILKQPLNTYASIGPFYSIKLKELTSLFGINFYGLPYARTACVVMWHANKYTRNIQRDYIRTYGFTGVTIKGVLIRLIEQGLLKPVNCKRPTNIGVHVPMTAYQITVPGRDAVKKLNELLESKILKLKA
jgi:hypothetical protein